MELPVGVPYPKYPRWNGRKQKEFNISGFYLSNATPADGVELTVANTCCNYYHNKQIETYSTRRMGELLTTGLCKNNSAPLFALSRVRAIVFFMARQSGLRTPMQILSVGLELESLGDSGTFAIFEPISCPFNEHRSIRSRFSFSATVL